MLVFVKLIFAAIELAPVPMDVFIVLPIALRFVYYVSAFAYTVDKFVLFILTRKAFEIAIRIRTGAIMPFLIVVSELLRLAKHVLMFHITAFARAVSVKLMLFLVC